MRLWVILRHRSILRQAGILRQLPIRNKHFKAIMADSEGESKTKAAAGDSQRRQALAQLSDMKHQLSELKSARQMLKDELRNMQEMQQQQLQALLSSLQPTQPPNPPSDSQSPPEQSEPPS